MSRSTKTRARKAAAPKKATTTTDPTPLPTRAHVTNADANAASATLYAGSLRIHAPYTTWTGHEDDTASTTLPDDTRLLYTRNPHSIEAAHLCTHGIWHTALITDGHELPPFAEAADNCTTHTPTPLPERALTLGTGLHQAIASAEETVALDVTDLRADTDQPQEHPEP